MFTLCLFASFLNLGTNGAEFNDLVTLESRLLNLDGEITMQEQEFLERVLVDTLGDSKVNVESVPAGNLSVSQDTYVLPGFDCGDGTQGKGLIYIYFPSTLDQTYPIVSFLHGAGSGVFGDLCYNIASLGIVVVAVRQGTCGDLTTQQLHAVFGSEDNAQLHPALKHVNYKSVGIAGHSMGGAWTMNTATMAQNYSIKAAIASHGVSQPAAPRLAQGFPMMFVAGTADPKTHKVYWAYQATPPGRRIFANIIGDNHMAPLHGSPINTMMAHFLGCYIIPRQESCNIIYGDDPDSLCKANPMADCDIDRY